MPRSQVLAITALGAISWIIGTLYFGGVSDRFGRVRTFVWGYIGMIAWAIPTWMLIDTANFWLFGISVIVLGLLIGATYGPQAALYAEMFPAKIRLSGVSIGYAIGSVLGGAFAPMIAQMLLNKTGNSLSIGIYIAVMSLISLLAVMRVDPRIQGSTLH